MIFKSILSKCVTIFLTATIAFLIHLLVNELLEQSITTSQLIYSYTINIAMACSVVTAIIILNKKLRDQLGFVFMGVSMLKFVFFFILFYPRYNADGDLSRLEFFTFFIPYVICLVTESVILSKFFNGLDD